MLVGNFNRHEVMSKETMKEIGELKELMMFMFYDEQCDKIIHEKFSTFTIENYLCGLYDGFDYSEDIPEATNMDKVLAIRPDVHQRLLDLCEVIKTYPKGLTNV